MVEKTAIAERLRVALAKELKRDISTIQPHHSLREDLGLNSLDAIELMFKVEEEFDLMIPDADLQKLATVEDLVNYIDARLRQPVHLSPVPSGKTSPSSTPKSPPKHTPKAASSAKQRTAKSKGSRRHA